MIRDEGVARVEEQPSIKLIPKSGVASSSGNNTIITPTSGYKIRLAYIGYNPSAPVEAAFRFGASGDLWLRYNIAVANSIIMKDLQAAEKYIEGAIDEVLILNLSSAVSTIWNCFYQELK